MSSFITQVFFILVQTFLIFDFPFSGTKSPATGPTSSKAPESLPPGPPVLMDVVWVPGYIIRVPFAMATQFFTQVRARVYVLSGECLHPITGEAIIAGVSKWTPEGQFFSSVQS